jgi:HEAT repeat protein
MPTREEIIALMQEDEFGGLDDLVRFGSTAVPILCAILDDAASPAFLRYRATVALGEIGERSAVETIRATLTLDNPVQKQMSLRSLAKIIGKDAVATLIAYADDPDPTVAKVALQGLADVGDHSTVAFLERHKAENPHKFLRDQADDTLKSIRERLG